jgi:hypothetical protein
MFCAAIDETAAPSASAGICKGRRDIRPVAIHDAKEQHHTEREHDHLQAHRNTFEDQRLHNCRIDRE